MTDPKDPMTLTFRCPRELYGLIPAPVPASAGLPDWLRTMPAQAYSAIHSRQEDTVKRCPPFIEAMMSGFLIPLFCDVRIEDGEFTWDTDLPACGDFAFARAPIGFHDPGQVTGTPLFDPDRFVIKFHNPWTIEAPEGYALLFTHPANRLDLPFTTLSGLVDCDLYHDAPINFPAHWHDAGYRGVLTRGTPIAQCFPVKRQSWSALTAPFSDADARRARDLTAAIDSKTGVYRRR
jgi:hypothetical protein